MSGRIYKNDISDVIGILIEQRNEGNGLGFEQIKEAAIELYDTWEAIPERSRLFIEKIFADNKLDELYQSYREMEIEAAQTLDLFEEEYADVLTTDNVNDIIASLQKKSDNKQKDTL